MVFMVKFIIHIAMNVPMMTFRARGERQRREVCAPGIRRRQLFDDVIAVGNVCRNVGTLVPAENRDRFV